VHNLHKEFIYVFLGLGSISRHSSVTNYETDEHETEICILCHQLHQDCNTLREQDDGKITCYIHHQILII
jgi:hypothetical protein